MRQQEEIGLNSWKAVYENFCVHLQSLNYAMNRDKMYQVQARRCIIWFESAGIPDIQSVRSNHVYEYVEFLRNRPHIRKEEQVLADATVTHHIFSIKLLFDYCFHAGLLNYTIPFPKLIIHEAADRDILTVPEVEELFAVCEHPRDRAMLSLLYGCGLRRSEAYWLDVNDINLAKRVLYVQEGKRRKFREVPLSDTTIHYLREYEHQHRPKLLRRKMMRAPEPAYLLNFSGCRLKGDGMYKRLLYLVGRTGNANILSKNITLHSLRHSVATHMAEMQVDMVWIQAFLGHSTPDTTHIYTRRKKRFVQS